uniref:Uncharacterized protein n=1 Tax=Meloidogyne enterolobii TaxID=390850 RepID=A0A6V7V9N1_MELEN|nr:unnamed protein product [Meloidogyne enterolobii]
MIFLINNYVFFKFITIQLDVLTRKIPYFTDPTIVKTNDAIIDLLAYCLGTNGIEEMAEYMRKRITFGCSFDNTKLYEKITKIFINLEGRFKIKVWDGHEKKLKKSKFNYYF